MGKDSKRLQWFITWPRTACSKEKLAEDLKSRFRPEEIYVAQELHSEEKEGLPMTHLHAVIKLPFDGAVNKKTLLTFLKEVYGTYDATRIDVRGVRNWKYEKDKLLNYLAKEDEKPLTILNPSPVLLQDPFAYSKWIEECKIEKQSARFLKYIGEIIDQFPKNCCDPRKVEQSCKYCNYYFEMFEALHSLDYENQELVKLFPEIEEIIFLFKKLISIG